MRKPLAPPSDTLIRFGAPIKALGEGRVGGYLVEFTSEKALDLQGEFFDAATDYGPLTKSAVLYHHGLDPKMGKRRLGLGPGDLKADEVGIWIEAQLDMRDAYEAAIYGEVVKGKMGWSSGTSPHLVERERLPSGAVRIKAWPLGLDASITPTPINPNSGAVALKSLLLEDGDNGSVSLSLRLYHNSGALDHVRVEMSCDRYGDGASSSVASSVDFGASTKGADLSEPERAAVGTYLDSLRPVVALLDGLLTAPASESEPDADALKSLDSHLASLFSAVEARGKLFNDRPS